MLVVIFFFNDTATTEIYTLSLHDALPILIWKLLVGLAYVFAGMYMLWHPVLGVAALTLLLAALFLLEGVLEDRKSTRLNSSHGYISYAVFCLKKKKVFWHGSHHRLIYEHH